jgi:hypothetical protein
VTLATAAAFTLASIVAVSPATTATVAFVIALVVALAVAFAFFVTLAFTLASVVAVSLAPAATVALVIAFALAYPAALALAFFADEVFLFLDFAFRFAVAAIDCGKRHESRHANQNRDNHLQFHT